MSDTETLEDLGTYRERVQTWMSENMPRTDKNNPWNSVEDDDDRATTNRELQAKLRLKDEKHFRQHYQQPAVAAGLIEMTIPEKPNSRLQKYRLTDVGRALVPRRKGEQRSP